MPVQDIADNAAGKRWSALVFAKRKLMVVALNYLLARCKALGFIKSDALVGFGGKLLASSQTVKVLPGDSEASSWQLTADSSDRSRAHRACD